MTLETKDIKELIEKLQKINFIDHTEEPPTYLDIIKKQSHEVIASNILEFFINPNNPHGLEDTFLRALANLIGINYEDLGGFNAVDTEVTTSNGGRIDLVIETDNTVIGIENKIYAALYNHLDDYNKYISEKDKDKSHNLIVLSLYKIENNAKNITYADLFCEVKKLIGNYVTSINAEYYMFLKHFINNIENLTKERKMLTVEEYKVLVENEEQIDKAKVEVALLRTKVVCDYYTKFSEQLKEYKLTVGNEGWTLNRGYGNNFIYKKPCEKTGRDFAEVNISFQEWDNKNLPFLITLFVNNNDVDVKKYNNYVLISIWNNWFENKTKTTYMKKCLKQFATKINKYWSFVDGFSRKIEAPLYNHEDYK